MAKKKSISENDIISLYMDYVLEQHEKPQSVYAFAKANNFEESEFYSLFGSFEAIDKQIYKTFFTNTLSLLVKSKDYGGYDARNKLLSFYFTFFEHLTANRSYVVYSLHKHKNRIKNLSHLSQLKLAFTGYIDELEIETLDINQEDLEKIKKRALQESAWLQLVLTLKFWLDDSSASFEKTDIFIEKSVNASFDVLNVAPIKSIMDLGKFIFKEKLQSH